MRKNLFFTATLHYYVNVGVSSINAAMAYTWQSAVKYIYSSDHYSIDHKYI